MLRHFAVARQNVFVQAIAFQIAWFLVLYSSGVITVLILCSYLFFVEQYFSNKMKGLQLTLVVASVGCAMDSFYAFTGWLAFPATTVISFNLVALWICFGGSVLPLFSWLQHRYVLAAVLGALFGPLSYFAGMKLGAVVFPKGLNATLGVYALSWGVLFPWVIWLSQCQLFKQEVALDDTSTR